MSGIAGMYNLAGQPVDPLDLGRMTDVMAHRGPDGVNHWRDGSTGLGHLMLHTTPESLHETLPLTDPSGHFTITADARIDNRAELISQLGVNGKPTEEIADSELILAAYKKWGEDCPDKLLGAFAFAIWDERRQQLFCARDHFGVKPFYYCHAPGQLFAFASEIKALLTQLDEPARLREDRLADYLASIFRDNSYTFYENVLRLPPAHALMVETDGATLRGYWTLDPTCTQQMASDAEYAAAFRMHFEEAVRCRMRSQTSVSALLSGGLDSSSIACVAARELAKKEGGPLHTFSAVFDEASACDERPFIEAVLKQGGMVSRYINEDDQRPVAALQDILPAQDEAFFAPGLAGSWGRYRLIGEAGHRVVLNGHGGDETVSHGTGYLRELAWKGRWWTLFREARGVAREREISPLWLWWLHARIYGIEPALGRSRWRRVFRRGWFAVRRLLAARSSRRAEEPLWRQVMNDALAVRTDVEKRHTDQHRAGTSATHLERERHFRHLTSNLQVHALEVFDAISAASGVEVRYPFWDKRLVEFCLSLPPDQKLRNGLGRAVLRHAMKGVLPESVRLREGKTDFLPHLKRGLVQDRVLLEKLLFGRQDALQEYIDLKALRDIYNRFAADPHEAESNEVFLIWKVAVLSMWFQTLNERALSPIPEAIEQTPVPAAVSPQG